MKNLVYDFLQIAKHNKDGSFATQGNRRDMLALFAHQLIELGYKDLRARDWKGRHIHALFKRWKKEGIADSTIRNRLAVLRWLCEKLDRPHIMPRTNAPYKLEPRHSVAQESKAQILPEDTLGQIPDQYLQFSIQLQSLFGMRREEVLKVRLWEADQGDKLVLQPSWTKGRVGRSIPIRTPAQRALLDQIKAWLPSKASALIPPHRNYIQQRHRYDRLIKQAGLHNLHGLRHNYSQKRFEEETGFASPVAGGPHSKELTQKQREVNREARLKISRELGHNRSSISSTYIGT